MLSFPSPAILVLLERVWRLWPPLEDRPAPHGPLVADHLQPHQPVPALLLRPDQQKVEGEVGGTEGREGGEGEKEDVALPREGRHSFLDVLDPLDLETKSFRDLTALLLSIKCHQAFFKIVIAHKVLTAAMEMPRQPICLKEGSR